MSNDLLNNQEQQQEEEDKEETSTSKFLTCPNGKKQKQSTLDSGCCCIKKVEKEKDSTETAHNNRSWSNIVAVHRSWWWWQCMCCYYCCEQFYGCRFSCSTIYTTTFNADEWIYQKKDAAAVFLWICQMAQWLEHQKLSQHNGLMILQQSNSKLSSCRPRKVSGTNIGSHMLSFWRMSKLIWYTILSIGTVSF